MEDIMLKKKKKLLSEWSLKKPLFLEKTDKRYKKYLSQLKKQGFSDSETWALDSVICQFTLPRLKRFREINGGYPTGLSDEKWNVILDKMIFALDWSLTCEDKCVTLSPDEQEKMWVNFEEGMSLFAKYFRHLWW
jgi:hypothetical protein